MLLTLTGEGGRPNGPGAQTIDDIQAPISPKERQVIRPFNPC